MKPHPHAEVIKAWADGAKAQYYALGEWHDMVDEPIWYRDQQFRIKPEPKPDYVEEFCLRHKKGVEVVNFAAPNLKLTFDGETGKLKSAEVL